MKDLRFTAAFFMALMLHCANIDKENTGATNGQGAGNTASGTTVSSANSTLAAGIYLADTVIEAPGHTSSGFYDKAKIINGVRGGGSGGGSRKRREGF